MNSGQMLLSVGALTLLMTVLLSFYRGSDYTQQAIVQTKLGITAVSLATSVIEDASGQAFDQNTQTAADTSLSQLTAANHLGFETGESYPDSINDFDDYNNLTYIVSDTMGGTFTVKCAVCYVNTTSPDIALSTQSWHKKLTVMVTAPQMRDTIKANYIFSYWYFR